MECSVSLFDILILFPPRKQNFFLGLTKPLWLVLLGSSQPLSWATRIKVAVGAARGFVFLHDGELQVIYRDVKASNILLDSV